MFTICSLKIVLCGKLWNLVMLRRWWGGVERWRLRGEEGRDEIEVVILGVIYTPGEPTWNLGFALQPSFWAPLYCESIQAYPGLGVTYILKKIPLVRQEEFSHPGAGSSMLLSGRHGLEEPSLPTRRGAQSAFLRRPHQMLISPQNTPKETPRITFYQIPGDPVT